jgi:hypothetical protein
MTWIKEFRQEEVGLTSELLQRLIAEGQLYLFSQQNDGEDFSFAKTYRRRDLHLPCDLQVGVENVFKNIMPEMDVTFNSLLLLRFELPGAFDETCWHYDNNADSPTESENGITMILYTQKDPTVIGGDLLYKLPDSDTIHRIKVCPGVVVVFPDTLFHTAEAMAGEGRREAFVFFLSLKAHNPSS